MFLICDVNQIYRQGPEEAKFSRDDWCNLLSISHRHECEGARKRSIKEINKLGSSVTKVDRIAMARKFGVEEWLEPDWVALVERDDPLTLAEAYKLCLEMTVLVNKAREKYIRVQRQGSGAYHTHGCSLYGYIVIACATTAQLVKGILGIE